MCLVNLLYKTEDQMNGKPQLSLEIKVYDDSNVIWISDL